MARRMKVTMRTMRAAGKARQRRLTALVESMEHAMGNSGNAKSLRWSATHHIADTQPQVPQQPASPSYCIVHRTAVLVKRCPRLIDSVRNGRWCRVGVCRKWRWVCWRTKGN